MHVTLYYFSGGGHPVETITGTIRKDDYGMVLRDSFGTAHYFPWTSVQRYVVTQHIDTPTKLGADPECSAVKAAVADLQGPR